MIAITIESGYYALRSPKDYKLIRIVKSLPASQRSWNGQAWLIDPSQIQKLARWLSDAGYTVPEIPPMTSQAIAATIQKQFTVEYVGLCKERDGGNISALGSIRGYWSIEFPESVLRDWFENREQVTRSEKQTLYQVLCVFESATPDEIKKGYWRLARIWHPDICAEDGAAEKFCELKDAYEVLSQPEKRIRYNAGLFFEREAAKKISPADHGFVQLGRRGRYSNNNYRSPLRCGLITAEGIQKLNRFQASRILAWDDITDGLGRVMTASWNRATESIDIKWV